MTDTQFSFGNIDEANTDGFDLAELLEEFEAAINSGHAGPAEPDYKIVGIKWRDTSADPNLLKMYDGAEWVTWGEIGLASHTFKPYYLGSALKALAILGIGLGVENDGEGGLKVKLDGSTLTVGAGGLKVADKGITATQIADGTIGALLMWGLDAAAGSLAPGADGYHLVSKGPGKLPIWSATAAGLVMLADIDLASAPMDHIDISIDTDVYASAVIEWANVRATTASSTNFLGLRLGSGGVINTGNVYDTVSLGAGGGLNGNPNSIPSYIPVSGSTGELLITAGRGMNGKAHIPLLDNSAGPKAIEGWNMQFDATGRVRGGYLQFLASMNVNTPIDIIRLFRSNAAGGNFLSGRVIVWGHRK